MTMPQLTSISDASARRLAYLACLVALETPKKKGKYSVYAQVDYKFIEQIREELDTNAQFYTKARNEMDGRRD